MPLLPNRGKPEGGYQDQFLDLHNMSFIEPVFGVVTYLLVLRLGNWRYWLLYES